MSLQAKIEAVIYASEEPVTLQQLIGLLGEEAQAELDALDSQQTSLDLALDGDPAANVEAAPESEAEYLSEDDPAGEAAGDEDALNAEVLDNPEAAEREEPEPQPSEPQKSEAEPEQSVATEASASETSEPESAETAGEPEAEPTGPAAGQSPNEKKLARERERRLRDYFRSLLDRLIADYAISERGLEIREVAGGFRMATKPEYHDAVRGFVKSLKPPLKLSLQALETLAVIAYRQPVTAPEISEVRGVESGGVLGTLMARKLIGTAGRKAVIGRPMLYKTTKEFLVRFGLKDINELPSIEEFEKMAGELNEPVQEEIPMDESGQAVVSEELSEEAVELISGDGSPVLDERNTAFIPTAFHETPEEMMGNRFNGPHGAGAEPSSGASADAARDVEQMADEHEPQADGDSTPTAEAQENPADDAIIDGRISGIPPRADADEADNPSAEEAAIQAETAKI